MDIDALIPPGPAVSSTTAATQWLGDPCITLAHYRIVRLVRLTSAPLLSSQIFGLESNRTSVRRAASRSCDHPLVYGRI